MRDTICNNCEHFKGKARGYGDCVVNHRTVYWQDKDCGCFQVKNSTCNKLKIYNVRTPADAKDLPCATIVLYKCKLYLVNKRKQLIPFEIGYAEEDKKNEMPNL